MWRATDMQSPGPEASNDYPHTTPATTALACTTTTIASHLTTTSASHVTTAGAGHVTTTSAGYVTTALVLVM